jgi:hypothetical protein
MLDAEAGQLYEDDENIAVPLKVREEEAVLLVGDGLSLAKADRQPLSLNLSHLAE